MTEQDFLAEILHNPADDGPRLVFSDWLSEIGDPRGEFIRVQCELASRPEEECGGLERREQELLAQFGAAWRKPIWRLGCTHLRFERGFLNRLTTLPESLSKNDHSIMEMVPLLDELEIQCVFPEVIELWRACLHATALSRVGTLILRDSCFRTRPWEDPEILDLLLDAGDRLRCHTLILNSLYLSSDDIAPILRRGHQLSGLRNLHLGGNLLHDRDALRLVESPLFEQLDFLELRWNFFSDAVREELRDLHGDRILV